MQYRESQGHESDLFLSYFRPCVIPTNGAKGKAEGEGKEPTLYQVKGRRFLHIRQVRRLGFCRGGGRPGVLSCLNSQMRWRRSRHSIK